MDSGPGNTLSCQTVSDDTLDTPVGSPDKLEQRVLIVSPLSRKTRRKEIMRLLPTSVSFDKYLIKLQENIEGYLDAGGYLSQPSSKVISKSFDAR